MFCFMCKLATFIYREILLPLVTFWNVSFSNIYRRSDKKKKGIRTLAMVTGLMYAE